MTVVALALYLPVRVFSPLTPLAREMQMFHRATGAQAGDKSESRPRESSEISCHFVCHVFSRVLTLSHYTLPYAACVRACGFLRCVEVSARPAAEQAGTRQRCPKGSSLWLVRQVFTMERLREITAERLRMMQEVCAQRRET